MSERPSDERLAEWRAMLADGNCHYVKAYVPEYMVNDGIRIITDLLAEVRELRQQLADCQAQSQRWRNATLKWREHAVTRRMQYATERARLADSQAQVAVLAEAAQRLIAMCYDNCEPSTVETCKRVDGCNLYPLRHAINSLPALATALLSERETMRAALEWYGDKEHYRRFRWTDLDSGTFTEAEVMLDRGERAREALREEARR